MDTNAEKRIVELEKQIVALEIQAKRSAGKYEPFTRMLLAMLSASGPGGFRFGRFMVATATVISIALSESLGISETESWKIVIVVSLLLGGESAHELIKVIRCGNDNGIRCDNDNGGQVKNSLPVREHARGQ